MNNTTPEQLENLFPKLPRFSRSAARDSAFLQELGKHADFHTASARNFGMLRFFSWKKASFGISFAALLFVMTSAWAYQPFVTRGHFLYEFKRSGEKIEEFFAISTLQKVGVHVDFSDRRLAEAEHIAGKDEASAKSTAFFAERAMAHALDVHLDSQQAQNLALTLAEMRSEIEVATELIEKGELSADIAEEALAHVEKASDKHVKALAKIENNAAVEFRPIVTVIREEEDAHFAAVVEAREEVRAARILKKRNVKVKLRREQRREQAGENLPEQRAPLLRAELEKTKVRIQRLPEIDKKDFEQRVDEAKKGIEEGRRGPVEGLSRAVERRLEHEKEVVAPPTQPVEQPAPVLREEGREAEKRVEQLRVEEIKRAEIRREKQKLEEQRLREVK